MTQLILDRAILETILERATSAARIVGYIDEPAVDSFVRPLADSIDEIVHTVTELLGNPDLIVTPVPSARSRLALDVVMRDNDAIAAGPVAEHVDTIAPGISELVGNPRLIAAPVSSACSTEPALGDDELTWPRVALRRLDAPRGAS
jgi:hypothetical protein